MRIAIASDHAGFDLKQGLFPPLKADGHELIDLGTHSREPVDYPDYAEAIALSVLNQDVERGILICGSGVGASIAANKVPGIRAGLCHDCYSAHQGVEHDHMNILVLGSRVIALELCLDIAQRFLAAQPSMEARHLRRLEKVHQIENRFLERKAS
jgi:RpiB/LacA/LacB family sugar-phosphate isomerase